MHSDIDAPDNRPVALFADLPADAVVIDVRSLEDHANQPLQLPSHRVIHMPFFRVARDFPALDQACHYLFYCDRALMSRLQAELLLEAGYLNVGVYRPASDSSNPA